MTDTPLYAALTDFAASHPLRMHMPGHKGHPIPGITDFSAIDFTELPPTGNLYTSGGPIEAAEQLWARDWGSDHCLFLTGGSTQGIHTALRCAAACGSTILVDRVSHRSIHTGIALLDQHPIWLLRPWLPQCATVGPLLSETLEAALIQHPEAEAVCVTSPTYYGVCSDIPALAALCHRHGVRLVVDAAHGAHLFLLKDENPYRDADLVVTSAHKTLRAPGQTALLFARNPITMAQLQDASCTFATSSPSYPMMAALDCVRSYYRHEGQSAYRRLAQRIAQLRKNFPCLTENDAILDPTRLTLCTAVGNYVEKQLQEKHIYPEMADSHHVVFILTDCDSSDDLLQLAQALTELGFAGASRPAPAPEPPEPDVSLLLPRQAMFGKTEEIPWDCAAGHIAAQRLEPYPPGVPLIVPGERISKKTLAYLHQIGYNKKSILCAAP